MVAAAIVACVLIIANICGVALVIKGKLRILIPILYLNIIMLAIELAGVALLITTYPLYAVMIQLEIINRVYMMICTYTALKLNKDTDDTPKTAEAPEAPGASIASVAHEGNPEDVVIDIEDVSMQDV